MPRAKLTGPDGRSAWLNVPDEATEEDIQRAIQGAMSQWPKAEAAPMAWSDVGSQAVQNIPKSAGEFVGNIAHAATHPVETVKTIADVGYGGLSKVAGAVGVPMDADAKAKREQSFDAVRDFFAERYGGVENFKRTLADDPVGLAADLSSVLAPAGVAARAPGVAGKAGKVAQAASRALDPITLAARTIKGAGKNVVAPVVGVMTGAGGESIRAAAKAGYEGNRVFLDNMRGKAGINDIIDMAHSAMDKIRQERSAAYKADMQGVAAQQARMDTGPVRQSIADARAKTHYHGVPLDEEATKVIDAIESKFGEFGRLPHGTVRSAEGMDALKRSIGEIRQRTQPGTLARKVADDVYHSIKGEIVKQVPSYARAMEGYSQASDHINDLTKTFSLGERAAPDTTARKLQSVMRNNVNTNYGRRTRLMDDLARHEPELPAALAGQTLSSATPRGLQGLGATGTGIAGATHMNPFIMGLLPFMSPRLMGEAAYGVGRVGAGVRRAGEATGVTAQGLAETLLALYQAGQLDQAQPELRGLLGE